MFVLTLDKQNAINFQLLGGILILQTFPAIVFSLYMRWFHRWGLLHRAHGLRAQRDGGGGGICGAPCHARRRRRR